MKVYVNGDIKEIGGPISLARFLEKLEMPSQRIAVEINKQVVRRMDWPDTVINDSDMIEIVHFVGGG